MEQQRTEQANSVLVNLLFLYNSCMAWLKNLIIFLLLVCLMLSDFKATAQKTPTTEINGFILSKSTGKGVSDAHIIVLNTRFGTVSAPDGHFSFSGIPAGNYLIQVSHVGYKTVRKKIDLTQLNEIQVKIFLEDTAALLKEVVISANHKDTVDETLRVYQVSRARIEALPLREIPDVLDFIPGITLSSPLGIFSSNTTVSMRGLPANNQSRVLVLLDGLPLNKSDQGSINWHLINKNSIDRIKVIKGPGPAMYGSGAMGGVIEIYSRKPQKPFYTNLMLDYGTYHTIEAQLDAGGLFPDSSVFKNLYWGISLSAKKSDGYISELTQYTLEIDSILEPVFLKEFYSTFKVGYSFNKNHQIEIQAGYYDDIRGNGFKVYDFTGANSEHDTYLANLRYNGSSGYFRWTLIGYYSFENYNRLYEYFRDGEYQLYEADAKREERGLNAYLTFDRNRRQEITAGVNYRLGSVFGLDIYYTSTDLITNGGKLGSFALFIQDKLRFFNNRLTVNMGLRYENALFYKGLFKIDYPSYSIAFYSNFIDTLMKSKSWDALCPKFSAEFLIDAKNRLNLSVAKGFSAPGLDDLCRSGKKKGGFKIANPYLEPEILDNIEIGYDHDFGQRLKLTASVYHCYGKDFMYYISTGDSVNMGYTIAPILKKDNISGVRISGAEAELSFNLKDSLHAFINYSNSIARIAAHVVNNPLVDSNLTGNFLTDLPDHKIGAGIFWENKIVNVSLVYKYVGKTWVNDLNIIDTLIFDSDHIPSWSVVSLRFDRRFTKQIAAFLNIENVFNKIYITTNAQRSPGRLISAGIKISL